MAISTSKVSSLNINKRKKEIFDEPYFAKMVPTISFLQGLGQKIL